METSLVQETLLVPKTLLVLASSLALKILLVLESSLILKTSLLRRHSWFWIRHSSGDVGSGDIADSWTLKIYLFWRDCCLETSGIAGSGDIAGSRVIAGSGDIKDICSKYIAVWRHCWFQRHSRFRWFRRR